jgi:Sec-independent protein translocase protein TatA
MTNSNHNVNTHVEESSVQIGLDVVGAALPEDEGTRASIGPARPNAFNFQDAISGAQKKAWFHNHKAKVDFEGAITHYGSDEFAALGAFAPRDGLLQLQFGKDGIAFPAGDGIEHLGALLRALNAFYNLRDCERLIDEAMERIDLGVSAENPIRHCQLNLTHVMRVLGESKLPKLHKAVQRAARKVHRELKTHHKFKAHRKHKRSRQNKNIKQLEKIKALVRAMRDSIATQTEAL